MLPEPTLFDAARAVKGIDRPEAFRPIAGFPGYFASTHGHIYTANGSDTCEQCGATLPPGPRKMFCSTACKARAHYERGIGTHVSRATPRLTRMSPDVGDRGHLRVTLRRDGRVERALVHRLILETFVGPCPEPGMQGCHDDGDPSHNWPENLKWGTQEVNWEDRKRHGRARSWSKLSPEQVGEIRRLYADGTSKSEIGRRFGVSATQVYHIVNEQQWKVA